jgi:hypothetical protein
MAVRFSFMPTGSMPEMVGAAAPTGMADGRSSSKIVGVFRGPWDTGWSARDGAVLGFEDVSRAFRTAANNAEFKLITAEISVFRDYQSIREFLAACDVVYANCGPWAALLYLVRNREQLDVRIIREVRTIGWIGYIWQEEVAGQLARPGDQRVFPSLYARDVWDASAPGVSDSRVYYPLIRRTDGQSLVTGPASGTVGFFSALSRDKGFANLPAVISRMKAAGHRIRRLVLAGRNADSELFDKVVGDLSGTGVDVSYRGELSNEKVRTLMAGCDCVYFLSVSSIESLGRVMVEACEQRVPVVTADFGAATDLIREPYRIPVEYLHAESKSCDTAFPLAELKLDRWEPPATLTPDDCFRPAMGEYLVEAQTPSDIIDPPAMKPSPRFRRFSFSFDCPVDALQLAEKLLDEPDALQAEPMHQLVDLGGALKQYLITSGYSPRVIFEPRTSFRGVMEPA